MADVPYEDRFYWYGRITRVQGIRASELLVAWQLVDYLNQARGAAWPAIETLRDRLNIDEKTVRRAIGRLERDGFLSIERRRGRGHSHVYRLALPETEDSAIIDLARRRTRREETEKPDICVPKTGHSRPVKPGTDAHQYSLRKSPERTSLTPPPSFEDRKTETPHHEASTARPSIREPAGRPEHTQSGLMRDQGRWEVEIAALLGPDGFEQLAVLNAERPSIVTDLCRRHAAGRLTGSEVASAALAVRDIQRSSGPSGVERMRAGRARGFSSNAYFQMPQLAAHG